jgi:DnaJ-domain-containing protein 1
MSFWTRLGKVVHAQVNAWVDTLEVWVESPSSYTSPDPPSQKRGDPPSPFAEYYANLELPEGATLSEVKQAYRRLVKKYHPDRYEKDPEKKEFAEKIIQRLNLAFERLEKHLSP